MESLISRRAFRLGLWLIPVGLVVGIGLALAYLSRTPEEYRSEATFILAPDSLASTSSSGGGLSGALSVLGGGQTSDIDIYLGQIRSRDFMDAFLRRHVSQVRAFRPFVSPKDYKLLSQTNRTTALAPGLLDRFRNEFFRVTPSSSQRIFKLAVTAADPRLAQSLGKSFLADANNKITRDAMSEAKSRLQYLNSQLAAAQNVELKLAISSLAGDEIRKATLTSGSSAFGIMTIDEPTFSNLKVWPSKLIVLGLGLINGLVLGILMTWAAHKLWR